MLTMIRRNCVTLMTLGLLLLKQMKQTDLPAICGSSDYMRNFSMLCVLSFSQSSQKSADVLRLTVNTPPEASRPCLIQWSHSLKWVSAVEKNHRNRTFFQQLLILTVFFHMFVSTQGLILTLCQFMPKDPREWL